ncbi:MAG: hypothetical protein OXG38_12040 [Chloroflexi bacterium]|nr:hypothetical protein [Chloroflexota bacterium]
MSEVAQVALITGVISLCVVFIERYWNHRNASAERSLRAVERKEDRDEWYRRTMFEKRLTTIQEAYEYLARLGHGIAGVSGDLSAPEDSDEIAAKREHLGDVSMSAWDWYNKNALYFDDTLPRTSSFAALALASSLHARGITEDGKDIWELFREAEAQTKARAEELLKVEAGS